MESWGVQHPQLSFTAYTPLGYNRQKRITQLRQSDTQQFQFILIQLASQPICQRRDRSGQFTSIHTITYRAILCHLRSIGNKTFRQLTKMLPFFAEP